MSHGLDVSYVHLGWYHMDRIVLTVETTVPLDADRFRKLPWLFQGFEIKYSSTTHIDATEQCGAGYKKPRIGRFLKSTLVSRGPFNPSVR